AGTVGTPGPAAAHAPAPLKQAAPTAGDTRQVVVPLHRPAAPRGMAQPSVQRAAEPTPPPVIPVRRSSPPPPPTSAPAAQHSVQRQPAPPVQRNAATQPPPATAPAPATAPQSATGANEQAPDIDALARRLVAPLSRLLRAELRGDRERIGRLRDR
ncbi:hypothetical protein ADK54_08770, partial [Streptomyces sp. WM6378]